MAESYAQGAIKVENNKGALIYRPGPVASTAHASQAKLKLAWGPLGTAKTTWLCWRIYYVAQRAALHGLSIRALLARDTYRNLVDSTLQTFLYWFPEGVLSYKEHSDPVDLKLWTPLPDDPLKGIWHTLLFRHGQTEQDASMFLSTEYDAIALEEIAPAYLPGQGKISPGIAEGVFDMALARLTRQRERAAKVRPEMIMTCNSPPTNHWASFRIIDRHESYLKDLNWAHWEFPQSDNAENLAADYYSSLEKAWADKLPLIRRFIRGERIPVFVGIPRFNLDVLDVLRSQCTDPRFRGFIQPTENNPLGITLEKNPEGWWKMWEAPKLGHKYVLGADVAEGVTGGDYSSAHILDCADGSIAAAFHGHLEPELFGKEEIYRGAHLYNDAKVIIESNNHGLTTLVALRNTGYNEIYYHQSLDSRNRRQPKLGFPTNPQSKPLIINGIGEFFTEGGVPCDKELITECMTFGIDDSGKTGAQEGCNDDRVISFGLALYLIKFVGVSRFFPHAKAA